VVGLLWAFTAAAMMSVGVLALPVALLATWLSARYLHVPGRLGAALSGVALIPAYIAILNREGPGTVCHVSGNTTSRTDEMSPWPWAAAAIGLLGAGAVLIVRSVRRR
jgi:hypothetical protein